MKEDLVMRMNTKASLATAENAEGAGVYMRLEGEEAEIYRGGTFQKAISRCIEQNETSDLEENKELAREIRDLLAQHSQESPLEINLFDQNKELKRNEKNSRSTAMHLEEKVEPYIERISRNGENYGYLDMLVYTNTKVGR